MGQILGRQRPLHNDLEGQKQWSDVDPGPGKELSSATGEP